MYVPGSIIYFDPFHFNDGSSKPKYFLVLKVVNEDVILASLPSSKVHLPSDLVIKHGCIEMADSGIGCYIFEANRSITTAGWSFQFNTFLYGMWLNDFSILTLQRIYSIPGVDYEIIGDLNDSEMRMVIDCFRKSSSVKRKYKKWLNEGFTLP